MTYGPRGLVLRGMSRIDAQQAAEALHRKAEYFVVADVWRVEEPQVLLSSREGVCVLQRA